LDIKSLSGQPIWAFERALRHWAGLGERQLLDQPLTAFFASRQCPRAAIRAAIARGCMAVVSCSTQAKRLSSEEALERNELVAPLAERVVIAHANAGGGLARQSAAWVSHGLSVLNFAERGRHR
jgi:hypothetical protein